MIKLNFVNLLKVGVITSLLMTVNAVKAAEPEDATMDPAGMPENQCSVFSNKIMTKEITNPTTKFVYLDNNEYISTNYIITFIEKSGYVSSMVVAAGGDIQSFCFNEETSKKAPASSAAKPTAKAKK